MPSANRRLRAIFRPEEQKAQQGARANDHGCHGSCSEQHEPRQPRSCLILNVRQTKMLFAISAFEWIFGAFVLGIAALGIGAAFQSSRKRSDARDSGGGDGATLGGQSAGCRDDSCGSSDAGDSGSDGGGGDGGGGGD